MDMETDGLLELLGRQLEPHLMQYVTGFRREAPAGGKQRAEKARTWLAQNRARLRAMVCPDPTVRRFLSCEATEDKLLLAAAVADLIAGIFANVAPVTVAVLLVKQGLKSLCQDRRQPTA